MRRFLERLFFAKKNNLIQEYPSEINHASHHISFKWLTITFNAYDNAYNVWKMYRKGCIDKKESFKQINDLTGVKIFLFLYPLYKLVKPLLKLKLVSTCAFYKIDKKLFRSGVYKVVYISGEPHEPGNLYRVVRYAQAVSNTGAKTVLIGRDELPQRMREIASASLLIIWRTQYDGTLRLAVKIARNCGARVVFDMDDLLIDPEMARVEIIDAIRSMNVPDWMVHDYCEGFNATMLMADICTASTEELARQIRRFNRPALVLRNGFDQQIYDSSRLAVRKRRAAGSDGILRIGYAAGTKTHQRDFVSAMDAVAKVLDERPFCRLVLFKNADGEPLLDPGEFWRLNKAAHQIEWRSMVAPTMLPYELARFDINIAPLEMGNPYCEAKSELKFFEAALVDVPTVASPTGPFRCAIEHGITGYLAAQPCEWREAIIRLVDDAQLRHRIARQAHRDVLWTYGPLRRVQVMKEALPQLCREVSNTAGFCDAELFRSERRQALFSIPESEVLFENDRLGVSEVTIVMPVYNCAHRLAEVFESIRNQTLETLDLILIGGESTDESLDMAIAYARGSAERFNRIAVLRSKVNAGMGRLRDVGFDLADTRFVVPLSSDARLDPRCCAASLREISRNGAALAYTLLRRSDDGNSPSDMAFSDTSRQEDVIALIAKEAWAAVGGYGDSSGGREDLEFLQRLGALGFQGAVAVV